MGGDIEHADVTFFNYDESLGTVKTINRFTNDVGNASFQFIPAIIKGSAQIDFRVYFNDTANATIYDVTKQYFQKIDHAEPKNYVQVIYNTPEYVNNISYISVKITDRYNNSIDNLNLQFHDYITFKDSMDNTNGFIDNDNSFTHNLQVDFNETGFAVAKYQVPIKANENLIVITAPDTVIFNERWITIEGLALTPDEFISIIQPKEKLTYADPNYKFTISYLVTDKFHNPIESERIEWNTSIGEYRTFMTNEDGLVVLEYAKESPQVVIINATLTRYPNKYTQDVLTFIQPPAADFSITAIPQLMPSRDVTNRENEPAIIYVEVFDFRGKPVVGEHVLFSFIDGSSKNSTLLTRLPVLDNGTATTESSTSIEAITDAEGYAKIDFYPGAFPTLDDIANKSYYNETAIGNITVNIQWLNSATGIPSFPKYITMEFRNYPFLRVETSLSNNTLNVDQNNITDVTIQIIGDGWALPPSPIDVVLLTNRGESMMGDMYYSGHSGEEEDKIVYARTAEQAFVACMTAKQDRIGIVTFGNNSTPYIPTDSDSKYRWPGDDNDWPDDKKYYDDYYNKTTYYTDYATVDLGLNDNPSVINDIINNTTPSKDPSWVPEGKFLSPMRYGLFKAITELRNSTRPNTVRAVILLTDRSWVQFGDPIARSTAKGFNWTDFPPNDKTWSVGAKNAYTIFPDAGQYQNMSDYAIKNNVRIYVIGYKEQGSPINSDDVDTFTILSNSTGGRYIEATDAVQLTSIYQTIAGELRVIASVNTSISTNFGILNVSYLNSTTQIPGTIIFDYLPVAEISTHITKYNTIPSNTYENYPYTQDDSSNWTAGHFNWYIGNMSLNDIWQCTYRLKVKNVTGNINLFGPGSYVVADNPNDDYPAQLLALPDTWVTVIKNWTFNITEQSTIDVHSLSAVPIKSTELLNISWHLNYSGINPVNQIAYYQYSSDNITWSGSWIQYHSGLTGLQPIDNVEYYSGLDVRDKRGYLKIKVYAHEMIPGGVSDEEIMPEIIELGKLFPTIKIE